MSRTSVNVTGNEELVARLFRLRGRLSQFSCPADVLHHGCTPLMHVEMIRFVPAIALRCRSTYQN